MANRTIIATGGSLEEARRNIETQLAPGERWLRELVTLDGVARTTTIHETHRTLDTAGAIAHSKV